MEGFCFPNTAVFASPLDARGQAQFEKVSAPPHLSRRENPTGSSQALGRNQSHNVIHRKRLVNPALFLAQRKGCGNSSRAGPGHIQPLQVPPAQPRLPKVQSAGVKIVQPWGKGGSSGGSTLPSNLHCPRSSRLLHPSPGDTGAGREEREQPPGPDPDPSFPIPTLHSLSSLPSPPPHQTSSLQTQSITQAAAGTGAELSNPASIAIPWDQESFFPLILYGAEHSASTG